MADYSFDRVARTASSESYVIEVADEMVGRVDLHFTTGPTYGTLCVGEDATDDDIQELISTIDEQLVMSADPYREDFVVQVWAGRAGGTYSDLDDDDEDDEEDEDENGNGRHP